MCLVIDACCLSAVFDAGNKRHTRFAPVLDWITNRRGRMIYGGTKYNAELSKAGKFLALVTELSRQRRTIRIPDTTVDPIAATLKAKVGDPEFDDEHLAALVVASRCRVVCTDDNVAISYLKRADLFSDYAGLGRPSIYRGHRKHTKLCCDSNVVQICREQP
jgi:hypothetical protein